MQQLEIAEENRHAFKLDVFEGPLELLLHLLKKLVSRNEKEDRSRINENSRRWEEKVAKGEKE